MKQLRPLAGGAVLGCCALLCSGSAQAINTNAYAEYPVRMTIGIVALVLALILAFGSILYRWFKAANRKRSYGEEMRYGSHIRSHKMVKKGKNRYGKGLRFHLHFPNYRGRKKQPAAAVPMPATIQRHRKIKGRRSRYGSRLVAVPTKRYTGGASKAAAASFGRILPASHKGGRGSQRRFGVRGLSTANPVGYKGGGSVAKPARFESTLPLSHRGRAKASKYYGGKMFARPVRSYKGGGSVAKPARFESTLPLSHRGRAKASKYYGGKMFARPVRSYKGGGSVAKPARFESTLPLSHRGRAKVSKYYGGKFFSKPVPSYKGGGSVAKEAQIGLAAPKTHHGNKAEKRLYGGRLAIENHTAYRGQRHNVPGEAPVIRIRVERGRANLKRYGGKIQFTSPDNVAGRQPIVPVPDSYSKRGKVTPGIRPVVRAPSLSYKGGNRPRGEHQPEVQQREPHRKMVGKPEQYGVKQYPGNLPSYKGK